MRWKEAGRYIGAGARILDIGGGYLYEDLLAYFSAMDWDYWYTDVGQEETAHARRLAQKFGVDPQHFSTALNHELDYEDGYFDAVFSSHCIEHSMNLKLTLRQLNRILRMSGDLVVSIPFGWDPNPNHPYFLLENEWLALVEDAGFRIRAYQIGSEYPEFRARSDDRGAKGPPCRGPFSHRARRFHQEPLRVSFLSRRRPSAMTALGSKRTTTSSSRAAAGARKSRRRPAFARFCRVFFRHTWSGIRARRERGGRGLRRSLSAPFRYSAVAAAAQRSLRNGADGEDQPGRQKRSQFRFPGRDRRLYDTVGRRAR